MDAGLWIGIILLFLAIVLLAGLAGLQIPLARKSAFWPGLVQPVVWGALALAGKLVQNAVEQEATYGNGAVLMAVVTLVLYLVGRFLPRRRHT